MCPILIQTPWFNIYSYGLLIAIGYIFASWWAIKEAKNNSLKTEAIFDLLILQLIVGVLGSRLLYLLEYSPNGFVLKTFFSFEKGGLTFYGAVICGAIFDLLFIKLHKLPFWKTMDCLGYAFPLGIAFGRIGCFFNGCCYGTQTSMPWGVVFTKISTKPLHPTQIYESICTVILFIILVKIKSFARNYGDIFLASIGTYAFFRFLIEFFRGDNIVEFLGMTMSQIISIVVIIMSILCWYFINKSKKLRIMPSTKAKNISQQEQ